ncbi:MAG: nucleotidyl transferase AbiEii/AbiGii toxin family protein [bacterium]
MLNVDLHRTNLVKILKAIYSDKELRTALGFKGGTAAFLFYNLPRFSVDLDFDLLSLQKEDLVYERLGKVLLQFGKVDPVKKKNTLFFLVDYGRGERKIKVEVSRRPTKACFGVRQYLGLAVLVMEPSSMISAKLVALLSRRRFAMRDLYDLWFFLNKGWKFDENFVEEALGVNLKTVLNKALEFTESLKDNQLLQGLGELLDNKGKDWVKRSLKSEVKFLLGLKLPKQLP